MITQDNIQEINQVQFINSYCQNREEEEARGETRRL